MMNLVYFGARDGKVDQNFAVVQGEDGVVGGGESDDWKIGLRKNCGLLS